MLEFNYEIRRMLIGGHARQVVDTIVSSKCRSTSECAMAANVLYETRLLRRALVRAVHRGG